MAREAKVNRRTRETEVRLNFNLDGQGRYKIETGIPFLDHMLSLFTLHGLFDLELFARGDLEVDFHHTVEDVGLSLGEAIRQSLGTAEGIRRFATAFIPMDEALAQVAIDISGRPLLVYQVEAKGRMRDFDMELIEVFFRALSMGGGITLHARLLYGSNLHHISEALFKALGIALAEATKIEERRKGLPSTKGVLLS